MPVPNLIHTYVAVLEWSARSPARVFLPWVSSPELEAERKIYPGLLTGARGKWPDRARAEGKLEKGRVPDRLEDNSEVAAMMPRAEVPGGHQACTGHHRDSSVSSFNASHCANGCGL